MRTQPACNLAEMHQLLGDASVVQAVCRLFLSTSIEARAGMEHHASTGDVRAFVREAHKLKGICGNVQAIRLRGICEELELSSESLPSRWTRLQPALDRELTLVRGLIKSTVGN
mgnify:CR=1 FL=1